MQVGRAECQGGDWAGRAEEGAEQLQRQLLNYTQHNMALVSLYIREPFVDVLLGTVQNSGTSVDTMIFIETNP